MRALVLAAGKGTRMRSPRPKVLHEIFGKPMLEYVLGTLAGLGIKTPAVVIGSGADQVRSFIRKREAAKSGQPFLILQKEQKGTGHAVQMAAGHFENYNGSILIWPADMPLLSKEVIAELIEKHEESEADVSVLSSKQTNPYGYGRILRGPRGEVTGIREEIDADEEERKIREVNSGVYVFRAHKLFYALKNIEPSNRKQELYLTDTIQILASSGAEVKAFALATEEEAQGINSKKDLAAAHGIINRREIENHMDAGVTFVSPEQTFVEPGVKIGADTIVYPWSYIEGGVEIGANCHIGPCAKLRKGTQIGDASYIGSFVEVNRSRIGKRVLAKHLAYLGDAEVGDDTNIGAGAITANFDGKKKHATRIGKKVLIGSNTVLVAPVTLEDSVRTGAGSVVVAGSKIKKGQVIVGVPAKPLAKKR